MHHSMEEVTHLQFYAHSDQSSIGLVRQYLDGLEEHHAQVQMHTICLGVVKLLTKNEERHIVSHTVTIQQVLQLFSQVRSILGFPFHEIKSLADWWPASCP